MQAQVQISDQGVSIRAQHFQVGNLQRMGLLRGEYPRQYPCLRVGIEKTGQTVQRSPVLRECIVRFTKERQCILHLPKCLRRLHDVTQLDCPAEEARCLQNEREHDCHLADPQVETTELEVSEYQRPGIHDQCREAPQQGAPLNLGTLVESDILGILTQAHQRIAEVGGELFVEEVQANQRLAQAEGDPGGDDHIQVHGKHHRPGNFNTGHGQRR